MGYADDRVGKADEMTSERAPILVVDDEWVIRQQLARALGSVGIPCDCAVDGDDALDKFRSHHHQLVVTDLRMPQHNGHSLAVTLLAEPNPPKVVALTGVMEPRLARDLLVRGVNDVVYKPINYFDLADRLKCMLETANVSGKGCRPTVTEHVAAAVGEAFELPRERGDCTREELENRLLQSPPASRWLTMTLWWFDWNSIPDPPLEMHEFLTKLSGKQPFEPMDERRDKRIKFPESAVVIQLDHELQPVGDPLKLLLRDLSSRAIGLLHSQQIESPHLAVMWRTRKMRRVVVLARIMRCLRLGNYFELAGMLVP
jgi:CheY-like chemotaxis protein